MEYIAKSEELIRQSIPGKFYPLDAVVTRFDIYQQEHRLYIDVYFSLPYHRFEAEKTLKLHFIDVSIHFIGMQAILSTIWNGVNSLNQKKVII